MVPLFFSIPDTINLHSCYRWEFLSHTHSTFFISTVLIHWLSKYANTRLTSLNFVNDDSRIESQRLLNASATNEIDIKVKAITFR